VTPSSDGTPSFSQFDITFRGGVCECVRIRSSQAHAAVRFCSGSTLTTNPGSINGELAGGMVMSLVTGPDGGLSIAVASNIAYANTSAIAEQIRDAFAAQTR